MKGKAGGHRGLYAAVVAVVCLLAGGAVLAYGFAHRVSPPPQVALSADSPAATSPQPSGVGAVGPAAPRTTPGAPTSPVAGAAVAMARSVPTRLDIPSIGVHSSLLQLGLNADDTVQVPSKPLLAGWYRGGPAPGQIGPAVILGHVDTKETGPAVFYRLGALHRGDRLSVSRTDGTVARFTVQSSKSYLKAAFPTLEVYGNTTGAELRLITCSVFDRKTRHYIGNTVVFATLDG